MAEKYPKDTGPSCESKNERDMSSTISTKESIPGRMLVRVKRRRSCSPAEAILLTSTLNIKRAKTDNDDSSTTDKGKSNSEIKIFRFTATLGNEVRDTNTKDLVSKVLEETSSPAW